MSATLHGVVSVPADNGSNATTTITITPPASMVEGDYVIVFCLQRGTGTWTNGLTGGQTWTSFGRVTATNMVTDVFMAKYDGTWDVNPRFDCTAGTNTSVRMLVFRPATGWRFKNGSYSVADSLTTNAATVTLTPSSAFLTNTLSIACWNTADDNTWGTLTGTNWLKTGLANQYRNVAGNDTSATFAYRFNPTDIIPNVSQTQLTLGTDLTLWSWFTIEMELIPPTIYDRNISFSLDSQIVVDSPPPANIYDESVTLASDHLINVIASLSYESSTTLSSNHDITVQNDLVAENTITFTSNNTIDVVSDANINNSVSINSDNTLTTQGNLDVNNSVQLDSNSAIDVTGGLDVHDSTTLTADSEVDVNNDLIIDQSVTLTTDNNVDVQNNLDASGDVTLTGNSEVDVNGDLTIDTSITLQNNNTIDTAGNLDVNNSVSLDSDSILNADVSNNINSNIGLNINNELNIDSNLNAINNISLTNDSIINIDTNLNADNNINLNSNNIIDIDSSLIADNNLILQTENNINISSEANLNNSIDLNSENNIDLLNNIDINENMLLLTESNFNDENLAEYYNTTLLFQDNEITLTAEQIAEVSLALLSLASLGVDADAGGLLESIQLELNNEVLFQIVLEAYNELSFSSDISISLDVVNALNQVLDFNIDTNVLFQISNIIESSISLASNSTIQTAGDVVSSNSEYDEFIVLLANANINLNDGDITFMKIIGISFIKNINKIIG